MQKELAFPNNTNAIRYADECHNFCVSALHFSFA